MALDRYPELNPDSEEVQTKELHFSPDVLLKAFALGPGGEVDAHEHADQTNVFHVLSGEIVVVSDGNEETISAPGVAVHERGVPHGARNDTDEQALFTATMGPMKSGEN